MIKRLWLYLKFFFASFARPNRTKVIAESRLEQIKDGWIITLTDRSEEKRRAYKEWSSPENIAKRRAIEAEEAPKALEAGRKAAAKLREELGIPEDAPLIPDPLPDRFKGQQPSTIRMMMRHENWKFNKDLWKWEQI